jgi:beta-lactam-binding protein with PASTA domain
MKHLRFLLSKIFFINLFKALFYGVLLVVFVLFGLRIATHHNDYLEVPDLTSIPFDRAVVILAEQGLRYEVLDSAKFNPEAPPLSILDHTPGFGDEVKVNRKIYLTLKAVGLDVGKITFRDNIGKNMVLEMRFEGAKIEAGATVPKTSKIDLVLGNGKR